MATTKEQFSDKVKFIPLADIHWDKRYREDFGDIEALAESIREKGLLQPVTISTDMRLLAGERRIRAAKAAGLERIPVLIRKIEGEIDAREIELMENLFRKNFSWHEEVALIREIDRLYRDKAEGTENPWTQRKTAQLLARSYADISRALKMAEYIDTIPELKDYKTADEARKIISRFEEEAVIQELRSRQEAPSGLDKGVSAMLQVGKANYNIGDTFKGLAELRNECMIDIIECDPPYGINLNEQKRSKESVVSTVHTYNEVPADDYTKFLPKLAKELYRVSAKDCWLIFWFGPTWFTEVKAALVSAGWNVDDIPAIWNKSTGQTNAPEIYLARAYEPFFIARKGQPILRKRGRANVFNYSPVPAQSKYHPTQRPMELMLDIMGTFGVDLQTVLVPFLGSGVTLRAAYRTGMKCFGWDISGEYKDRFLVELEHDARALTSEEE